MFWLGEHTNILRKITGAEERFPRVARWDMKEVMNMVIQNPKLNWEGMKVMPNLCELSEEEMKLLKPSENVVEEEIDLKTENQRLKKENEELRIEIQELKAEIGHLKTKDKDDGNGDKQENRDDDDGNGGKHENHDNDQIDDNGDDKSEDYDNGDDKSEGDEYTT
ncbi:hypothetical protein FRX31_024228 [Thalictrum thalictroides]|uniref:Uncharacterized protein n=1 Tax=Thalictrum thalictroides TaxID=46969 RepID=A0A7J6VPR0_THATH|nr:hypothetical protein FRX31_024228 [Thalictrum thalictroides]